MLRLVHPAHEGQPTDPPARRKGARSPVFSLTADEGRHALAALRATARAYGGIDVLAAALGLSAESLYRFSKRRLSGTLAIRLAAAAGMAVEIVLSGKLSAAGRCPTCGTRAGDRPERGDPAAAPVARGGWCE